GRLLVVLALDREEHDLFALAEEPDFAGEAVVGGGEVSADHNVSPFLPRDRACRGLDGCRSDGGRPARTRRAERSGRRRRAVFLASRCKAGMAGGGKNRSAPL